MGDDNNVNSSNSYELNEEKLIQYKIQKCHSELYRQRLMKSTKHVKEIDFHHKINRLYSKMLVKYHWLFLVAGVVITITLTGLSFMKQPLPNFLDPKRGFGARGEGTLTSQLIVMKNINTEMTKYHKYILDLYEKIKKENRSSFNDFDLEPYAEHDPNDISNTNNTDDLDLKDQNYDYDLNNESNENEKLNPKKNRKRRDMSIDESVVDHINILNDKNSDEYKNLMRKNIYKKLNGSELNKLLDDNLNLKFFPEFLKLKHCNYSLGLDENLEYYFSSKSKINQQLDHNKIFPSEFLAEIKNLTSFIDSNEVSTHSNSLLNLDKLNSLCKWDQEMLEMLNNQNDQCYLSLPRIIALFNNKTSCFDLNENDVRNFVKITLSCLPLHKNGILYAFSEEYKQKPEIIALLNKNNPLNIYLQLNHVKDNICVNKNLFYMIFEHLIDKGYLTKSENYFNIKISTLLIGNTDKKYDQDFLFKFYMKKFHSKKFENSETQLVGLNLAGVRQEAAMRILSSEMSLVALAITLIVIVTLLYLRSIFISMIVNIGVAMSVGVAFFAYRIVFEIDLFPFINMMAAFLLIGIACDNVYVLFDAWYNEKARIIMEDLPEQIEKQYSLPGPSNVVEEANDSDLPALPPVFIKNPFMKQENHPETGTFVQSTIDPLKNSVINNELIEKGIDINEYTLNPGYVRVAPLTDEQMIRAMGGTLHHAASSIFVTSFTTSAAFMTNFITKLPYVQLFGFFTGSCILVYFLMVITMIAAFVITYEKNIQPCRCKLSTKLTRKLEETFEKTMETVALINHRIIAQKLPYILIKLRVLWFSIFLILGVCGMLIVFYQPKLKPPSSWRYQFFKNGNHFENFEFKLKDEFSSYINEEKRNLTNPEIFFLFGVMDKDNGRLFNPDDDGHLVYDSSFDFLDKRSQLWLNEFINVSIASRPDLFLADEIVIEWRNYLFQMQQFCYETLNIPPNDIYSKIYLPFERESLSKCRDEINSFMHNSTLDNFENLMSSFPRRIIFMSNGSDVNAIMLRVNANRTFIDYDAARDYYIELKAFHEETFTKAPAGFNSGWFISVAFALYDLQYQLITGTYSSLVTSMIIAFIILLITSGNLFISIFAIITISFSIADTIAIFVLMGWELSILESVVIIMSVGLSVDFSCHYGVAYINSDREFKKNSNDDNLSESDVSDDESKNSDNQAKKKCKFLRKLVRNYQHNNIERFIRINDIFNRVGSAVLMAAFTTFLAGSSMYPSELTSFGKMGQFLMLVMLTSYLYATFFFVPLCALLGPTKNFGNLRIKHWTVLILSKCFPKIKDNSKQKVINADFDEQVQLNEKKEMQQNGISTSHNHTSNL